MSRIKKHLQLLCLVFPLLAWAEAPSRYAPPQWVGEASTMGHGVQRVMNLLASSTTGHKHTVRILFYGQSITEQKWWNDVANDLRARFPNASLVIENRAIGGHAAQLLVKTAEADLYPFYPDLLIFHVYGSHIDYENIIRRVRERTTAEILMQNDHVTLDRQLNEETDPAKLTPKDWDAFMNHLFLPQTARKYGAALADQRAAWKHYLKDQQRPAASLLKDGVHLNDHGCFLMAELVKPWLRLNPTADDRSWTRWVRTLEIGKDIQWDGERLELDFEGNRLDAIAAKSVSDSGSLEVWIDGQRPSAIPSLRRFTRVSAFPNSNWPCLLQVQSEAPLEIEDWTLTLTEVSEDLKNVKFVIRGSKTGEDGEGVSTRKFVSHSKRIVIEPSDWNLGYCRQVFKRTLEPGCPITWKVVPMFQDQFHPALAPDETIENSITLAQGLPHGTHHLELRGKSWVNLAALRVYRPPGVP